MVSEVKNDVSDRIKNPQHTIGCDMGNESRSEQCRERSALRESEVKQGNGIKYSVRDSLKKEVENLKRIVSGSFTF